MQPSQLLKEYNNNKKDLLKSLLQNKTSFNNDIPSVYIKQEFNNPKSSIHSTISKNIISSIGNLTLKSVSFLLANKFGIPHVPNNLLITASSSVAIGTFVLQNLGTELKKMSFSTYSEKLKEFFDKEILKEFNLTKKEKTSVEAQFDNSTYYNVNISEKLSKLIEKEKLKLQMQSIFTSVKDTMTKFNKPSQESSSAPKI